MSEPDWEALLLVSDSGLWLGVHDGRWVVGRVGHAPSAVEDDPRPLLPLLDRDWSVARLELSEVEQRRLDVGRVPLEPTLRLALTMSTDHWPSRALAWIIDGFPPEPFWPEIAVLAEASWLPQRSRQQAHRILSKRP